MRMKNEIDKTQYLRVIGRLYPDNRLVLRPGYLTENPANSQEDPDSPLAAELYDKEGKLLLHYRVPARPYCADGQILSELAVRGKIPFPATTRVVRFYRDRVMLHEITVSEDKPVVKLNWVPPKSIKGKQGITWTAQHPQQQPMQFFLRYTHTNGKTWQRIGWRITETATETAQEVNFDELPGSTQCRIAVVATDGANTVTVESKTFSVPVKPCRAMILAPEDGATLGSDEPVLMRGQGFYLEENKAETEALIWTSSKDGELGRGMTVQIPKLSPGSHRITLTASIGKRAGKATVSIQIDKRSKQ